MPLKLIKNSQAFIPKTMSIALPLVFALTVSNVYAFEPFQANYTFNIAGMLSGTATRTLSVQNDIWNYSFKASVVKIATASEFSHFRLKDDKKDDDSFPRIESLDHAYNLNVLMYKKNSSFKVDWDNKTVAGSGQDGANTYPAQVGMLDMLDLELQVREDIKHKQLKPFYLLADDKGVNKISFVNEGEEKVTTNAGTFDTIRVRLVHENPKRKTFFWLAPKLDYLPVQVRQDDGNLTYMLNLNSYKSNAK